MPNVTPGVMSNPDAIVIVRLDAHWTQRPFGLIQPLTIPRGERQCSHREAGCVSGPPRWCSGAAAAHQGDERPSWSMVDPGSQGGSPAGSRGGAPPNASVSRPDPSFF